MTTVVLVIHLMLAMAMIFVVLIQPSEGGGLGITRRPAHPGQAHPDTRQGRDIMEGSGPHG